ncbi:MAG: SUF system NifU family Fe-S cluster assembly protein [Spirochaetaceae bacterium]|nr:SUF system NifU family Fe-S cluster assembly protein [Spirochaetaceae bacterium]
MSAPSSAARELYQQVILDHNRTPRNWGALQPHTHHAEGHNPLCGDRYEVAVALADDGSIADIRFQGSGCAISKASASMMTEAVKGLPRADADRLVDQFRRLAAGELDPARDQHDLGKLRVFSGIWEFPARVKCATLPWHTLHSALDGSGHATTEAGTGTKE